MGSDGGSMANTMSAHSRSVYVDAVATPTSGVTGMVWAIAIVWFGIAVGLGASGGLPKYSRFIGPFVVMPLIAFALAFVVSPRVRAWAFAFDTRTLVMAQAVRVGGIAFLAVYAVGRLNGLFAVWAGLLDAVVGVSALFVAHSLTPPRTAWQRGLLIAWMGVGILDFVVAVPLALIARASD